MKKFDCYCSPKPPLILRNKYALVIAFQPLDAWARILFKVFKPVYVLGNSTSEIRPQRRERLGVGCLLLRWPISIQCSNWPVFVLNFEIQNSLQYLNFFLPFLYRFSVLTYCLVKRNFLEAFLKTNKTKQFTISAVRTCDVILRH